MLTTDGLHEPVTPLSEVVGKVGTLAPLQMVREAPKPNTGVVLGFTVTFRLVGRAHKPGVGVKV